MSNFRKEQISTNYQSRTPSYYLSNLDSQTLESFTNQQLEAVKDLLEQAIPKPSPKIVDLRFVIDLIFSRFYVVLFVGKDVRQKQRYYPQNKLTQIGNLFAAVVLLIGSNLVISASILLVGYLVKSGVGIDLFADRHLADVLKSFLRL